MSAPVGAQGGLTALVSGLPLGDLGSPARFDRLAARLIPGLAIAALLLALAASVLGLVVAPTDARQGDAYRIVFIHVPAAWMSLLLYLVMALAAALTLGGNAGFPALAMTALAPTGALFTLIALWTGSLWGKPTWGVWWVWDARLTSELILLFLYLGFMAIRSAFDDPRRADRAGAVLVLVGVANIPILYFSVRWWNTLHQGSSAGLLGSPGMARTMLAAMLMMALAFCMYAGAVVLARVRCLMLERAGRPLSTSQELSP